MSVSEPVLPHKREKPLRADLRRLDLRLHVADDEVGRTDIVAQELPDRPVWPAVLDDLDRLELQAFGIRVDGADDARAAWSRGADVQMMGGRDRKADQLIVKKDRHAKGDVRARATRPRKGRCA